MVQAQAQVALGIGNQIHEATTLSFLHDDDDIPLMYFIDYTQIILCVMIPSRCSTLR